MSLLVGGVLSLMVLASWLGAFALANADTSMRRIHAASFLAWGMAPPMALAALLTDGVSPRGYKCVLILLAVVLSSALLSHVTGRALHLREGQRQ